MASGELVLPADLLILPVERLAEDVRRRFTWTAGDFALTRPRLRTPSRVVDARAAALLRQFAAPASVVEAVVRHSREHGLDPETTLDAAYPLLTQLVREGFLIEAAAAGGDRIEASWQESERIAGFRVVRCMQVLEDNEVYQVRPRRPAAGGPVPAGAELALKIERRPWPQAAPGTVAGRALGSGVGGVGGIGGIGDASAAGTGSVGSAVGAPRAGRAAARLVREAAVLDHLGRGGGAPVAPRLVACGSWQERRFLAQEWCPGVEAQIAAGELRQGGAAARPALLALCREVAGAFARLHARGVLHGDVRSGNVLVAADGRVWLIDYGFAHWQGAPAGLAPAGRPGVAFGSEPEAAAALLAGTRPAALPAPTALGEQHAVAALLYLMATGAPYADFSLERESLLRQIAGSPPLPFAARGERPWPGLETVLGRALAKQPEERFPSVAALAAVLDGLAAEDVAAHLAPAAPRSRRGRPRKAAATGRAVESPPPAPDLSPAAHAVPSAPAIEAGRTAEPPPASPPSATDLPPAASSAPSAPASETGRATGPPPPVVVAGPALSAALRRADPGAELLAATLARLRPDGPLWRQGLPAPPVASVHHGAAGIACALYRMALVRQDAELLAQADLWSARARAAAAAVPAGDAFYNPALGLTPEALGEASLYHTEPGVHCVEALIAQARGDLAGAARAVAGFVAAARRPAVGPDLALGRAGLLLGCALLLPALPDGEPEGATPPTGPALRSLGDELLAGLWQLDPVPPPPQLAPLSPPEPLPSVPPLSPLPPVSPLPPISTPGPHPNLGIAHGWAGLLYASLRWCQAARRPLPAAVPERLAELGAAAESWGRGRRWRWHTGASGSATHGSHPGSAHRSGSPAAAAGARPRWMAGWCNGSAGMVHLWTLAARMLDDAAAWQLAVAAAWHAWEAGDGGESLCCGLAGRAYALLDLHRWGGGAEWLARARTLAGRAAAGVLAGWPARREEPPPESLYRGRLGVALLAADLEHPATAAMPLFGDEGWG